MIEYIQHLKLTIICISLRACLSGLTNGVAAFQKILDQIIEKEDLKDVFVYVDNVTICGHIQEEHDANLKKFLEATDKFLMTFNKNKTNISVSSIAILGYIVEKGIIKPDPARFQALGNLLPPQLLSEGQ